MVRLTWPFAVRIQAKIVLCWSFIFTPENNERRIMPSTLDKITSLIRNTRRFQDIYAQNIKTTYGLCLKNVSSVVHISAKPSIPCSLAEYRIDVRNMLKVQFWFCLSTVFEIVNVRIKPFVKPQYSLNAGHLCPTSYNSAKLEFDKAIYIEKRFDRHQTIADTCQWSRTVLLRTVNSQLEYCSTYHSRILQSTK